MNHQAISRNVHLCIVIFITLSQDAFPANILILQPNAANSHYAAFDLLTMELVNRGHNVTVINRFPKKVNLTNYTEIDLSPCIPIKELFNSTIDDIFRKSQKIKDKTSSMYNTLLDDSKKLVSCSILLDALKINVKYDLVMTEIFYDEVFLGFVYKFNAPMIIMYANSVPPWISQNIGTPNNPSCIVYSHNPMSFHPDYPSFYERLYNTFIMVYTLASFNAFFTPASEEMIAKYIGPSVPSVAQIERNASLVLTFSNFILNGPRPLAPGVIEVGGMHIKPKSALPKDIEDFIESAEHGVIYFSMGSLIVAESLSVDKKDAFLYAFSKVPQKVLWKWDGELPGKTEDIFVSKWMPQRDILAHPKVKLFIAHGGALGLYEAAYEGVPILGIPIYGDQRINTKNMVYKGAGELLDYYEITNETILNKISLILNNSSYKENAVKVSEIYRDRPMSPLDTAVYWTEYVIRHKGAHHLKSAAIDLPLYQYLLLDVIAFVISISLFIVFILYCVFKQITKMLTYCCARTNSEKKKQK